MTSRHCWRWRDVNQSPTRDQTLNQPWAWVSLSLGYVLIAVQFMYCRILRSEKWRWCIEDLAIPLITGFVVSLLLKTAINVGNNQFSQLIFLGIVLMLTVLSMLLSARHLRQRIVNITKSYEFF